MARHKQEDPWAGFVDVLSNILMVVVFLVVILGISIFALSQQITKAAVDKAVRAERASQAQAESATTQIPPAPTDPVGDPSQPAKEQGRAPAASQVLANEALANEVAADGERGTAGAYETGQALRARQADDVAGNSNLSLRSAMISDTKTIEIASEEAAPAGGPVEIKASQAFLTLKYQRGAFKIDDNALKEIGSFLSSANIPRSGKVEIRAFAQSTVGSVSEARRIAYYRAMQARSELMKHGIDASRVELKIRESGSPEEMDVVRIYAKP